MPKVSSPDRFKIPAFQRKRSLAAKARRVCKPATAFERKEAGVSVIKTRVARRRMTRSGVGSGFERREIGGVSGVGESFSSPLLDDLRAEGGLRALQEDLPAEGGPRASEEEKLSRSGAAVREMRRCGVVEDFFDKISVVAVRVTSSIRIGDRLVFETEDGLFEQVVDSMQINRKDVVTAYNGDDLGIKVLARPKKNGSVHKVV